MKQLPVPRDRKKVAEKETVAPTRRRHTGGRSGVAAGKRRKKVMSREDSYTYIAALRSPHLLHTTQREGDTSVTVVTSNVSVSQCVRELLKRKGLTNRRCRKKKICVVSRTRDPNRIPIWCMAVPYRDSRWRNKP